MKQRWWLTAALSGSLVLLGCEDSPAPEAGEGEGEGEEPADAGTSADGSESPPPPCEEEAGGLLEEIECSRQFQLPGLSAAAQVVFNELGVPHIFGANIADTVRVHGYVAARDRYFGMELVRRDARGQLAGWLSSMAIERDILNRTIGKGVATAALVEGGLTPDLQGWLTAYAAGVNAYVDAALAGEEPYPAEFAVLAMGTGQAEEDLFHHWEAADVASVIVAMVYQEAFDSEDVGRARAMGKAPSFGVHPDRGELPALELRRAAALEDITGSFKPLTEVQQHPGARQKPRHRKDHFWTGAKPLPAGLQSSATHFLQLVEDVLPPPHAGGSNAWAVSASLGAGGAAYLANDPHLSLQTPSFFYQLQLDTSLLSDGSEPLTVAGVTVPGIPIPVIGHTNRVAWGITRLHADVTDYYLEELSLEDGLPATTTNHLGEAAALRIIEETYVISGFPLQDLVAATCIIRRYETADGRMITSMEGTAVDAPEDCNDPRAVNVAGQWLRLEDTDGDGRLTAISMDFTGLDANPIMQTALGYLRADSVDDWIEAQRHSTTFSNSLVAADADGRIASAAFQGTPRRAYLRDQEGGWQEGGNPWFLLDATRFPGFSVTLDDNHHVSPGADDPSTETVAFEDYPRTVDPESGYLVVANNDPTGASFDNDTSNDPVYIAQHFSLGLRAQRITELLQGYADDSTPIGVEEMARVQGDHMSTVGRRVLPHLLAALNSDEPGCDAPAFDEVEEYLNEWQERGLVAESGVETFYHPQVTTEEARDSVATTLFNTWTSSLLKALLEDEALAGVHWNHGSTTGRTRLLVHMLEAAESLAGFSEPQGDHVFWDDTTTPEIETRRVLMCRALSDTLDLLSGDEHGGFGTPELSEWRWGSRHTVAFVHPMDAIIGTMEEAAPLVTGLSIKPETLRVADRMALDDPRRRLAGYPRPGDNHNVDAAHPGWGTPDSFSFSSGASQRLIIRLHPDGVRSEVILPGGQSGQPSSDNWADQARVWLANARRPIDFSVADVKANGRRRWAINP